MKRFLLGVGLLIGIFILGLWIGSSAENRLEPITRDLEQAAAVALAGDLDGGGLLAKRAITKWEDSRKVLAILTDHGPMDKIDALLAQARSYREAGFRVEFAACCNRIAKLLRASGDVFTLTWWNFL